ncbi:unnamed protein product [Caretta caretta]
MGGALLPIRLLKTLWLCPKPESASDLALAPVVVVPEVLSVVLSVATVPDTMLGMVPGLLSGPGTVPILALVVVVVADAQEKSLTLDAVLLSDMMEKERTKDWDWW